MWEGRNRHDVYTQHGAAGQQRCEGVPFTTDTATSVISVSASPPLLAFSLPESSSLWPAIRDEGALAVNFLTADQEDVSARFSQRGIDRFAAGGWRLLATGEPVIEGAATWVRGAILQRTPAGGSYVITVKLLESSIDEIGSKHVPKSSPLIYHDRAYHRIR
ncbi:flavin reductase family protein [Diaminobutyricibacter sp. McL0608]|uniref:flavin reductase family protein n=1 Tax=Leifsonia sp. McL0608 TaxID=3143537 RepID=UPI0031F30BDE